MGGEYPVNNLIFWDDRHAVRIWRNRYPRPSLSTGSGRHQHQQRGSARLQCYL